MFYQAYNEELSKRIHEMNDVQKGIDGLIKKWEQVWTTDKVKIVKLYALKYDNPWNIKSKSSVESFIHLKITYVLANNEYWKWTNVLRGTFVSLLTVK